MKPSLLTSAKTHLDFALVENYPLRFSKAKSRRLECLSGMVWITVYNELPDYMLMPGDVFVIPNNGLCVVDAIGQCQVRIDLPSLSRHVLYRVVALVENTWQTAVLNRLRGVYFSCVSFVK